MKTRLAILVALAAVGVSSGAYAVSAPVAGAGVAPGLYPSEQGAFKLLEAASQLVEARIVQRGCAAASFDLIVNTNGSGNGSAVIGNSWDGRNFVTLNSAIKGFTKNDGRKFEITSRGGVLDGLPVGAVLGKGGFNANTTIQQLSTDWKYLGTVQSRPDDFYGSIIKDYTRLSAFQSIPGGFDDEGTRVSMVIDYGYQQISKNGYPKAKYWQESKTWREDGVNSGTWWKKTRVAPTGCTITVNLQGYGDSPSDSIEGFNEAGTISVK